MCHIQAAPARVSEQTRLDLHLLRLGAASKEPVV